MYVIDLDGTLYDNSQRAHLIPEDKSITENWVPFNSACDGDELRTSIFRLVDILINNQEHVVFMTGRGENARTPTLARLSKDFALNPGVIRLVMRPMDDHRSAALVKRKMLLDYLDQTRHGTNTPVLAIDDDADVCDSFRSIKRYSVTVLQIDSMCSAYLHHSNDNDQPRDCCPTCQHTDGFHSPKCPNVRRHSQPQSLSKE